MKVYRVLVGWQVVLQLKIFRELTHTLEPTRLVLPGGYMPSDLASDSSGVVVAPARNIL